MILEKNCRRGAHTGADSRAEHVDAIECRFACEQTLANVSSRRCVRASSATLVCRTMGNERITAVQVRYYRASVFGFRVCVPFKRASHRIMRPV